MTNQFNKALGVKKLCLAVAGLATVLGTSPVASASGNFINQVGEEISDTINAQKFFVWQPPAGDSGQTYVGLNFEGTGGDFGAELYAAAVFPSNTTQEECEASQIHIILSVDPYQHANEFYNHTENGVWLPNGGAFNPLINDGGGYDPNVHCQMLSGGEAVQSVHGNNYQINAHAYRGSVTLPIALIGTYLPEDPNLPPTF